MFNKFSKIPFLIGFISSFSTTTTITSTNAIRTTSSLNILKNNNRLLSIYDYALTISPSFSSSSSSTFFNSVADIGCDHGLLSLALHYNNQDNDDCNIYNEFNHVYAVDSSEPALNNGIIRKKQFIDNKFINENEYRNLHIMHGHGLNALTSNNIEECDVIIAAGMGCNTLNDIFLNNNYNNDNYNNDNNGQILRDLNVKQIIINPWPPSFIRQHLLHCSLIQLGYVPERQTAVSHYNGNGISNSNDFTSSYNNNNNGSNNNNKSSDSNDGNRKKEKMSVITSFNRQDNIMMDVDSPEAFALAWPIASSSSSSSSSDEDIWKQYANKELMTIENNIKRRIQSNYYNDELLLAARGFLKDQR